MGPIILTDPDRRAKAMSRLGSPFQFPRPKAPYAGNVGRPSLHWPRKGGRWFALGDPSTGNPSEMDPLGPSSWKSLVSCREKSPVQGWGQKR